MSDFGISTTISAEMKILVGTLVFGWSVVTQQLLAATVYAVLNSYVGRVRYFGGYIQEYLLWTLRDPTLAWSPGEMVSNAVALIIVVVAVVLFRGWMF